MKGALELKGRERDGTERNAYEDIMEAMDEGKQGPVLREQREIVEQCAPDNVLADVVMEMECFLGSLKDFSFSSNGVRDPEGDRPFTRFTELLMKRYPALLMKWRLQVVNTYN
jgi:hypothetical protein